jgi:hypothetical protein
MIRHHLRIHTRIVEFLCFPMQEAMIARERDRIFGTYRE